MPYPNSSMQIMQVNLKHHSAVTSRPQQSICICLIHTTGPTGFAAVTTEEPLKLTGRPHLGTAVTSPRQLTCMLDIVKYSFKV